MCGDFKDIGVYIALIGGGSGGGDGRLCCCVDVILKEGTIL